MVLLLRHWPADGAPQDTEVSARTLVGSGGQFPVDVVVGTPDQVDGLQVILMRDKDGVNLVKVGFQYPTFIGEDKAEMKETSCVLAAGQVFFVGPIKCQIVEKADHEPNNDDSGTSEAKKDATSTPEAGVLPSKKRMDLDMSSDDEDERREHEATLSSSTKWQDQKGIEDEHVTSGGKLASESTPVMEATLVLAPTMELDESGPNGKADDESSASDIGNLATQAIDFELEANSDDGNSENQDEDEEAGETKTTEAAKDKEAVNQGNGNEQNDGNDSDSSEGNIFADSDDEELDGVPMAEDQRKILKACTPEPQEEEEEEEETIAPAGKTQMINDDEDNGDDAPAPETPAAAEDEIDETLAAVATPPPEEDDGGNHEVVTPKAEVEQEMVSTPIAEEAPETPMADEAEEKKPIETPQQEKPPDTPLADDMEVEEDDDEDKPKPKVFAETLVESYESSDEEKETVSKEPTMEDVAVMTMTSLSKFLGEYGITAKGKKASLLGKARKILELKGRMPENTNYFEMEVNALSKLLSKTGKSAKQNADKLDLIELLLLEEKEQEQEQEENEEDEQGDLETEEADPKQMKKPELVQLLESYSCITSGNKPELLKRVLRYRELKTQVGEHADWDVGELQKFLAENNFEGFEDNNDKLALLEQVFQLLSGAKKGASSSSPSSARTPKTRGMRRQQKKMRKDQKKKESTATKKMVKEEEEEEVEPSKTTPSKSRSSRGGSKEEEEEEQEQEKEIEEEKRRKRRKLEREPSSRLKRKASDQTSSAKKPKLSRRASLGSTSKEALVNFSKVEKPGEDVDEVKRELKDLAKQAKCMVHEKQDLKKLTFLVVGDPVPRTKKVAECLALSGDDQPIIVNKQWLQDSAEKQEPVEVNPRKHFPKSGFFYDPQTREKIVRKVDLTKRDNGNGVIALKGKKVHLSDRVTHQFEKRAFQNAGMKIVNQLKDAEMVMIMSKPGPDENKLKKAAKTKSIPVFDLDWFIDGLLESKFDFDQTVS